MTVQSLTAPRFSTLDVWSARLPSARLAKAVTMWKMTTGGEEEEEDGRSVCIVPDTIRAARGMMEIRTCEFSISHALPK